MARQYFGTSRWDDIPQTLGLSVEGGVMRGTWQGVPVEAYFDNRYDRNTESYSAAETLRPGEPPPASPYAYR